MFSSVSSVSLLRLLCDAAFHTAGNFTHGRYGRLTIFVLTAEKLFYRDRLSCQTLAYQLPDSSKQIRSIMFDDPFYIKKITVFSAPYPLYACPKPCSLRCASEFLARYSFVSLCSSKKQWLCHSQNHRKIAFRLTAARVSARRIVSSQFKVMSF